MHSGSTTKKNYDVILVESILLIQSEITFVGKIKSMLPILWHVLSQGAHLKPGQQGSPVVQ